MKRGSMESIWQQMRYRQIMIDLGLMCWAYPPKKTKECEANGREEFQGSGDRRRGKHS